MEFLTQYLPILFVFVMGLAMMIYALLDGYDLGVGLLSILVHETEKDLMISSIGPFWDANETWLVLGVGILLIAFPQAHGIILSNLYVPVFLMLVGLIFRGVAFEFRLKCKAKHKSMWNAAFFIGSLLAAYSQGYMLAQYIVGFENGLLSFIFSNIVGLGVSCMYVLIGACWLIMKTENNLQKKAAKWAKISLYGTVFCIALISLSTPIVSSRIYEKWFSLPQIIPLSLLPIFTLFLLLKLHKTLHNSNKITIKCWLPFALTSLIYVTSFLGLAYSFYPFIIPNQMTIHEAASSTNSLIIILIGVVITLPLMLFYTAFVYKVFKGKVTKNLSYDE